METLFKDTDLFSSGELKVTKFDIPDAELTLHEHFFNREEADRYYEILMKETPWKEEPITLHGKTHIMPRLIAWYGKRRDGGKELALTETLLSIKERIEKT